jgi:outer membrane protein OmpA-like peptidoglycan-associated protein
MIKIPLIASVLTGAALIAAAAVFVEADVRAASRRLAHPELIEKEEPKAAVADYTEAPYCTKEFKEVLDRVLNACGLVGQEARRGCEPADVKSIAQISDDDFVALFTPLKDRGAIIMFDDNSDVLDDDAKKLVTDLWNDRKGAKYFFIVARASKTGTSALNQALSHKRANSVKFFLDDTTKDPNLDKQVGMLWLGSEFAQLPKEYCDEWKKSREPSPAKPKNACNAEAINRSAFVSWVDCRL